MNKAMHCRIIVLLLLFVPFYTVFSAEKKPKTILILHSYNQGLKWTDALNKSITQTIEADSFIQPDFRIEYMDTKRFESESYFQVYQQYLLQKYKDTRFDLLISTDNAAFNFFVSFRKDFMGNPPVAFCGLNYTDSIPDEFTGITEDIDIYSNINSIIKIHPDYKKIYFVLDKTITGNVIRKKNNRNNRTLFSRPPSRIPYRFHSG
ncbi:MAG: hypothetical protein HC905_27890 [Bacteroidales bacterium]|nr:hypothetical protein [Bacteroidales bacterium]